MNGVTGIFLIIGIANGAIGLSMIKSLFKALNDRFGFVPPVERNIVEDSTSDAEIKQFTEKIFAADANNVFRLIKINRQRRTDATNDTDYARKPLLQVKPNVWRIPMYNKTRALYRNYIMDSIKNEPVTAPLIVQEDDFLNTLYETTVMKLLRRFLLSKHFVTPNDLAYEGFFEKLWFRRFPRTAERLIEGSSTFEHVFMAEMHEGYAEGLHNWLYYHHMERAGKMNYLGYLQYVTLGKKAVYVKIHSRLLNRHEIISSMFIGTSVEFEMAVYVLCIIARPNRECRIQMGGKEVIIYQVEYYYTYYFKYIVTVFPEIEDRVMTMVQNDFLTL